MKSSDTWTQGVPLVAIACWLAFVVTVMAMPLIKDGYSPIDQPISEGVLGEYGGMQTIGFFFLAAGTLMLVACLQSVVPRGSRASGTIGLLALSAICVIVLAVFKTDESGDRTWQGRVHVIAASLAFVTIVLAMLWSGWALRGVRALTALASVSLAFGIVTLALLIALGIGVGPEGLVQRATVGFEIVWLTMLALSVRRHALTASDAGRPLQDRVSSAA